MESIENNLDLVNNFKISSGPNPCKNFGADRASHQGDTRTRKLDFIYLTNLHKCQIFGITIRQNLLQTYIERGRPQHTFN